MKTFYWHDYETWGATPSVDRPSQFAGVRTDEDFNIIGEPLVEYCQPPEDIWPHPEACLVTGITPQKAINDGLPEHAFIAKIHRELSKPQTCTVGYNSLRFDDEVTRYTLYRNFYDPYEREWRNGNSRWDIIDMVRLCYALRPEGIEWPVVDGKPSFRLENLTVANNILHASAHDAYSDVDATIKLAKLIKDKKTALFNYVFEHKSKQQVSALIDIKNRKPLLHISSKFSSERGCAGLIVPLACHPVNRNAVIAFDLSSDPTPLASLSAVEIAQRVFTSQSALPDGVERIPIKLVHVNKCPILATPKLLDEKAATRLGIDKTKCEENWQKIRRMDIGGKLESLYREQIFEPSADPEQGLYNGFIGDRDKALMGELRAASEDELNQTNFVFDDARLNTIFPRYKARNFPHLLREDEKMEWHEFVRERLRRGSDKCLSYEEICCKIRDLKVENVGNSGKLRLLNALEDHVESAKAYYQV